MDPAGDSGSFLISYCESRLPEIDILRALRRDGQLATVISQTPGGGVDQFRGIELGGFPACIAEVALWMMDHIMHTWLSLELGRGYIRIPL